MPRYLTLGTLTIQPGRRAIAEGIADQGVGLVSQQPGFVNVRFFLDRAIASSRAGWSRRPWLGILGH
jgi:hypothetical protein